MRKLKPINIIPAFVLAAVLFSSFSKADLLNPSLKIMRSKEISFVKPDILSCYDAAFLSDGKRLVCVDTFSQKVIVIDSKGNTIRTIGEAGIRPDQYKEPIRLAIDKEDNVYVLDNKKPRIFIYSSDGKSKQFFDTHTIDEKEILDHYESLTEPVKPKLNAILVHGDNIYAADKMTGTIQIYDKADGTFIDYYRKKETSEILFFSVIGKMLLSDDGMLYLAKILHNGKIKVIDFKTGEELYEIGQARGQEGSFYTVNSMVFDNNGNIVVSDGVRHTVQVFSKDDGEYLYHVGDKKAGESKKRTVHRPEINLDYPGPINFDSKERIWIYLGMDKGFTVRKYIGDSIWDIDKDETEM